MFHKRVFLEQVEQAYRRCSDSRCFTTCMTFDALGVLVMISGPGDTKEEVAAIREAIATWNADHAADQKIVFVPKHYSTDAVPVYVDEVDGQAIINEQITDVSDVVIAVFRHRLGTPTPRDEYSGTVEEAKRRSPTGKVHVFFWEGPNVPRSILDDPKQKEQWDRLQSYRGTFHANTSGIYKTYETSEQLKDAVLQALWWDARKLGHDRPDSMPSPRPADPSFEVKVDVRGAVWHLPTLANFLEFMIERDIREEREWATENNTSPAYLQTVFRAGPGQPRVPKSDVQIQAWADKVHADLHRFDEQFAAAAGTPVEIALAADGLIENVEVEVVFHEVVGLDREVKKLTDIWTPLHVPPPLGPNWDFPSYNLDAISLHTSWEQDGDDVVLIINAGTLRKRRLPDIFAAPMVLMIPTDESADEISYTWTVTGANNFQEVGQGRIPIETDPADAMKRWMTA